MTLDFKQNNNNILYSDCYRGDWVDAHRMELMATNILGG